MSSNNDKNSFEKDPSSLQAKLAKYEQETFQMQKQVKELALENDTLVW